jgi:hypothetical protein
MLLLQITTQRARLDLPYRWQRNGHYQLLHRGTYEETIVGKGTSLNCHFPLPTKKRVTAQRLV